MDIKNIDLNLLVIFEALLVERNVSRAAKAVGLSQSATSSALGRLRAMCGDPLLLRTPKGMLPTDVAAGMFEDVRAALKHARQAFEKKPAFDPAKSERVFTLIATDFIQMLLATKLMSTLASVAPGVSVTFKVPTGAVPAAALATGDADLAFAPYTEAPAGIYRQKLFSDRLASTVRAGHPNVGDNLPLKDFLALKHVVVSFSGGRSGSLDAELARRSLKREIAIVVPYLYLALRVVSETATWRRCRSG